MTDSQPTLRQSSLSAEEFAASTRHRGLRISLLVLTLSLLVVGGFVRTGFDTPLIPLTLLVLVLTPFALWHWPRGVLYVTFASVCLFEIFPVDYADDITSKVPFFWNINTIFQRYAHVDFKAVPLNLLEVFLLAAGACSLMRSVFTRNVNLRVGSLFWPILIYVGFVSMGWINGMATGGDLILSLQEVRSQFYFLLAYLVAANQVREHRQATALLWTLVLCMGLKGALYTFRRYFTMHGLSLPDQGVGSHEEAFLFDCFILLLPVLILCRVQRRLQWVMWALLPLVLTGELACNRRAGTAAIAIAFPILLLAAYLLLPERRKFVGRLGLFLAVGLLIYYPTFKNSDSAFAQPARAIRSQFAPDARDASSNEYRDAENADLMATIKLAPIQGYGYGKRMLHAVPIADISQEYAWWDVMTHNQVLWVWMRVGTPGYLAFWMMISAIVIQACRITRDENTNADTKAFALFSVLVLSMLTIFGLLDLQFSNFRDMLCVGIWAGVLGGLPQPHGDRRGADS